MKYKPRWKWEKTHNAFLEYGIACIWQPRRDDMYRAVVEKHTGVMHPEGWYIAPHTWTTDRPTYGPYTTRLEAIFRYELLESLGEISKLEE